MNEQLKYQIAITLIPGIGDIIGKKLIAYTGSPEAVFSEKKKNLLKVPGIGEQLANEISNCNVLERAEKEIVFIEKNKIKAVFYLDPDYPVRLKHCNDSPLMLYIKGDVNFNSEKIVSIVGTRNATQEGKDNCNKLIEGLKNNNHNALIISGLAFGIDICAHKAALKNDLKTIAVLGHGLDMIYPASHKQYVDQILEQGAIVTEFMSNCYIDKQNFVKRNRIIAGLSDACIVVESGETGGALITSYYANSYNRDVFAFPGRITDKYSVGCNKLIKTNQAALIESITDLEYVMNWLSEPKVQIIQTKLFVELTEEEKVLANLLKEKGQLNIDIISIESQMPMSKISSLLLNMEFAGVVKSLPGKVYTLTSNYL